MDGLASSLVCCLRCALRIAHAGRRAVSRAHTRVSTRGLRASVVGCRRIVHYLLLLLFVRASVLYFTILLNRGEVAWNHVRYRLSVIGRSKSCIMEAGLLTEKVIHALAEVIVLLCDKGSTMITRAAASSKLAIF